MLSGGWASVPSRMHGVGAPSRRSHHEAAAHAHWLPRKQPGHSGCQGQVPSTPPSGWGAAAHCPPLAGGPDGPRPPLPTSWMGEGTGLMGMAPPHQPKAHSGPWSTGACSQSHGEMGQAAAGSVQVGVQGLPEGLDPVTEGRAPKGAWDCTLPAHPASPHPRSQYALGCLGGRHLCVSGSALPCPGWTLVRGAAGPARPEVTGRRQRGGHSTAPRGPGSKGHLHSHNQGTSSP